MAAGLYKVTGGRFLPERHEWKSATEQEALDWIDRRGQAILDDPDAPADMKEAISERNTDYIIKNMNLEINHAPAKSAGATVTCTAITQWCSYSNCSPKGKCIREYYCCGYPWGCQYEDRAFACPSCPCPRM